MDSVTLSWSCFGDIHSLDLSNFSFKVVNSVLESVIETSRNLFVCANEQLIDFDGRECGASCSEHGCLELLENLVVNDLSIVLFDKPVSLDVDQIIKKVLNMRHKIVAKVFDRLFGLHDLFDFFA